MDLETYASRYSGETRLRRLLLIAQTTSDNELSDQSFHLAEQQMKHDGNVIRYNEVFRVGGGGKAGEGEYNSIR
jgi:hypothetical protein